MGEAGESQLISPVLSMASNGTTITMCIGGEDQDFPLDMTLGAVQRFADERGEAILWCRFPTSPNLSGGESDGSAISATQEHASTTAIPKAVEGAGIPRGNPPGVSAQARPSPRSIPKRTHAPPSKYGNVRVVRLQATRDGVSQPVKLFDLGMATTAEEACCGRGFGTFGCYRQPDDVSYLLLPFGTEDARTPAEKQKNIFRVLLTTPEGIPWKHKQRVGIRSKDTALVFFLLFSPKDAMEKVLECFLHRDKVGNWHGLVKAVRERIDSLERIVPLCKNASGAGPSHEWDDDAEEFAVFNEDSPTLPLAKRAKFDVPELN